MADSQATEDDINARYDPMNRDELIAECERLRARVKWLEDWKDACEDTIARLNRKALHGDVSSTTTEKDDGNKS